MRKMNLKYLWKYFAEYLCHLPNAVLGISIATQEKLAKIGLRWNENESVPGTLCKNSKGN